MECKFQVDERKKSNIPSVKNRADLTANENLITQKDSSLYSIKFSDMHDVDSNSCSTFLTNSNGINDVIQPLNEVHTDIDPLDILQVTNNQFAAETFDGISNAEDSQQVLLTNDTEPTVIGCKRRKYAVRKLQTVENKCAICHKKFESRPDFIKHAQIYHPNAKAFKCRICFMVFTNIHSVSRHRRIHKDMTKKHVCEYCTKSFLHKDSFKRHLETHTKERSYTCSNCDKTYKHKNSLENHQKTHIKQETNDGDIDVNLIYKNSKMSDIDISEENTDLKIIKEELSSNYNFQIQNDMNLSNIECNDDHQILQVKNDEEIFKIEIVEDEQDQQVQTFENNCKISRRKPMLAVDKNCAVCHKEFNFRQDLVKHVKLHHPNAKAYKCNKCSMRFANIFSIARHRKIHKIQPKKNICPYCPKSFMHKDDFNRHLGTHYRKTVGKNQPAVDRKCAVCHEEFEMRLDLIEHVKQFHPNAKAFKCGLCSMVFTNIHYIARHRRIHKDLPSLNEHVCEVCSKSFAYKESLKRHLVTHTNTTSYSCSWCKKSYKHKVSLNNHIKIHCHTESNEYNQVLHIKKTQKPVVKDQLDVERKCAVCQQEFDYRYELLKHARQNHPNAKAFKCGICSMLFKNIISISRHSRIHKVSQKKFGCKLCSKYFISKDYLKCHMKTHSRERPFSCSLCKNSYDCKETLTTHQNTHMTQAVNNFDTELSAPLDIKVELTSGIVEDEPILQVNNNGEFFKIELVTNHQFENVNSLELVSTVEDGNKNKMRHPKPTLAVDTKCAVCQKEFNCRQNLIKHAKLYHPNAKAFKCAVCSMLFANVHSIARHRRIHKKSTKTNICPYCSKSILHKDDFKRHLKIHAKNRSYNGQPAVDRKCAVCHKEFSSRQDLMNHAQLFHPNAKAFKCGVCSMVFTNIHYISRHRRKHKDMPRKYICEICSTSFIDKDSFNRHLKTSKHKEYSFQKNLLKATPNNGDGDVLEEMYDGDVLEKGDTIGFITPDIKDELHTEGESQDAVEVHNSSVICKTEYVCDESIINAVEKVENRVILKDSPRIDATLEDGYISETPTSNKISPKDLSKKHVCELCSQSFISGSHLRRHLSKHSIERPYSCPFCGKSYKRKDDMKTHQRKFHLNQYLKNKSKCLKEKKKVKNIEEILKTTKDGDKIIKHIVDQDNLIKKHEEILNLNNHDNMDQENIHENVHNSPCIQLCNVMETSNIDCVYNETMSFRINQNTVGDEEATNPIDVHEPLSFIDCSQENLTFLNNSDCKEKQLSSSSLEIEKENSQEKTTLRDEFIKKTSTRRKDISKKNFCELCCKSFVSNYHFRRHLSKHTKERPFSCSFCVKSFKRKDDMKTHQTRFHSEHIWLANDQEDISINLADHIEGNFYINDSQQILKYRKPPIKSQLAVDRKCAVCQKKFNYREDLIKHVQLNHPHAKAFKCNVCCMLFTNVQSISRHRKIHKELPKIKLCPYCPKSFSRIDYFRNHLKDHRIINYKQNFNNDDNEEGTHDNNSTEKLTINSFLREEHFGNNSRDRNEYEEQNTIDTKEDRVYSVGVLENYKNAEEHFEHEFKDADKDDATYSKNTYTIKEEHFSNSEPEDSTCTKDTKHDSQQEHEIIEKITDTITRFKTKHKRMEGNCDL